MGHLPDDLIQSDRALIETHISWVLLGPREVWKLKKPVDFGFLDFRSLEARRLACEAEVRLNRRLARGVYLGVEPITAGLDGRFQLGGTGKPVDYAVHMRRLQDETRADVLLAQGRLDVGAVERIATCIARFHAAAAVATDACEAACLDTVVFNVKENFGRTQEALLDYVDPAAVRELERWQLEFLDEHAELFSGRLARGRVREGHGDLRLEHVYLGADPDLGAELDVTVIDCIEFNERFRIADVCCDLAFLTMDLAYHGRVDLAERLLSIYARESADYELYRLVDFYQSYRAHVRAKVSLLLAADASAPEATRAAARDSVRKYFLLAVAEERRPLMPPILLVVGGVIASGKSTVASALSGRLGAPVVESDRTRKFLSGVAPGDDLGAPPFEGAYAPERTRELYTEILHRADAVLAGGRSVILDASFRARAERDAARKLASRHGVRFLFVECRAAEAKLRERLRARRGRFGEVSDAREDLLETFLASWEPTDELPEAERLLVDTAEPLEAILARLSVALPLWPPVEDE